MKLVMRDRQTYIQTNPSIEYAEKKSYLYQWVPDCCEKNAIITKVSVKKILKFIRLLLVNLSNSLKPNIYPAGGGVR